VLPDRARRRSAAPARILAVALASVLVVAGCAGAGQTASPSPPLIVAAFGDSLAAEMPDVCPGCTSWVKRYADALRAATGRPVEVRNLGRPSLRVEQLAQDLAEAASAMDAAAAADAILVAVGTSDAPWNITDDACDGEATAMEPVPWEEYSDACLATEVERFRPAFETVYRRLAELRAGKPTILRTINRYNDWIGFEEGVPPEGVEVSVDYNVAWNAMICDAAEASGFACADVSGAFNGEDGRTASGDLLADDYLHPSDKGYERIASVVIALGFAPLAAWRDNRHG
jgi:lysophospholipase L1-like esterase